MIAEGTYTARAVSAMLSKSPTKGTPCAVVTLRIEQPGPHKGELIDWIGWLSEATRARTAESLALMGFDGADLATVQRNEVAIVIEHETFTTESGATRTAPRVRWINDPKRGRTAFTPLDPAAQNAMLKEIRGLVLAAREQQAKHSHQQPAKDDDEVPF
jgi:hypothetical protein